MARGFATHRVRKSTGPRRAAAEHVTANRGHRAVRAVAEPRPQVRMTQSQTRGRWDRCTAAELRPHRCGCTIAAGGEACVQSQTWGAEAVYTIACAGAHLPPRGYRLPCRPHCSLRAGRRTSTYRRLGRGIHREAWAPGLRDWEVDAEPQGRPCSHRCVAWRPYVRGPRRAAAEHVTMNRGLGAVRGVAEPRPQVRMTWSQTQGRWGGGRCTAAELRPHRYGCTIAAGGEACVQSQTRGVQTVRAATEPRP